MQQRERQQREMQQRDGGGNGGSRGGLEIETAAGILMASIFAFFILTYTVFLQCWWRCRRGQRRRQEGAKAGKAAAEKNRESSSAEDEGEECSCFAQTIFSTWEQVDTDKLLAGRTCNVNR